MSENIIPEGSTPIAVTPPAEGAPAPAPEAVPAPEAAPAPEAPVLSQEAQQYNYEREMFSAGAASNGMELPGNFKDFGDYFDSLKEAQGQYTSARQELAALKAEQAASLINPEEPVEGEAVEGEEVELPDSLEIKEPEAEAEGESEEGDYEVYEVGMTEEEAMSWTSEYMESGELGEETMESILKSFPGATEEMVNIYFQGLKSIEQQSVQTAAQAVGGEAEHNNILHRHTNLLGIFVALLRKELKNISLQLELALDLILFLIYLNHIIYNFFFSSELFSFYRIICLELYFKDARLKNFFRNQKLTSEYFIKLYSKMI